MFERFTHQARKVMALANQHAQRLNHEYIGTEHLLLAIIQDGDGVGVAALKNLSVDPLQVSQEIEQALQKAPKEAPVERFLPQTPSAKKVVQHAIEEARETKCHYIGSGHLLLGILHETDSVAARVLANLGVRLELARAQVALLPTESSILESPRVDVPPLPFPPSARHVLITGASTGLGRETALHLAGRGYTVHPCVRKPTDLVVLLDDWSSRRAPRTPGGGILPLLLDVTHGPSIAAAAAELTRLTGPAGLHALINNAGIGVAGPIEHVPLEDWRRQFEVNFFGQIAVTQAFLPLLRQHLSAPAGGSGRPRIIMISSIAGRVGQPILSPYSSSKFALESLSDGLRLELAPQGIHVSVIQPGAIQSEIWRKGQEAAKDLDPNDPRLRLYQRAIQGVFKLASNAAANAIPASHVARAVERCLTAKNPPTRILVGSDAKSAALLKWLLPDRWFDRLIASRFGV